MSKTNEILGKSLVDNLKEQSERFMKWVTVTQDVLRGSQEYKQNKDELLELNKSLCDLSRASEKVIKQLEGN